MPDERNERISEHAYRLWEKEGQPADRALDHWVEAERRRSATAAPPGRKPARVVARARAPAEIGMVGASGAQDESRAEVQVVNPAGDVEILVSVAQLRRKCMRFIALYSLNPRKLYST